VKRGCDLLTLLYEDKIKRSQPRFTRQLLHNPYMDNAKKTLAIPITVMRH
jgi:hypothetical protein